MDRGSHTLQVLGSLLVAAVIVAIVIVVVTERLGPTSVAELDAQEARREQRIERAEERREQRIELEEARRESSREGG
jgi:flagellar biosynthesis/type III secretory pathway M-ring protein FliF/YscJ